jgi:membrane protein implicated in regulation of membrane protease activity
MGQTLVGKIGSIVRAVRTAELPGEVRVVVEGIPHFYLAYCTKSLAIGTDVLVINNRGSRCVDVEPWSQPLTDVVDVDGPSERH